jgi:hypothetical protein
LYNEATKGKLLTKSKSNQIDQAINSALQNLQNVEINSDEYFQTMTAVERLYALKNEKKRVSPDTAAIVGGNLIGIIIIVAYEHAHVIVSKSFNLLLKTR